MPTLEAFQFDAFLSGAFQSEVDTETGYQPAFQAGVFQLDAFQVEELIVEEIAVVLGGNLWGYGKDERKDLPKYHPWIHGYTKSKKAYKEIVEDEELPKEVQEEAIAIIRPFVEKKKKAKTPQISTIDWEALASNREKVSQMLMLWEEVVERQRIEIEEEENIELLLLAA